MLNTVLVTLFIISSILVASMVADVVEDSEVTTGRRSEGIFFAVNAFVQKSVSGIGIFTSTLLLNAIHFPRNAQPGTVDPIVVRNLALIFMPAVVGLYVVTIGCLTPYPLDPDRQHPADVAVRGSRSLLSALFETIGWCQRSLLPSPSLHVHPTLSRRAT